MNLDPQLRSRPSILDLTPQTGSDPRIMGQTPPIMGHMTLPGGPNRSQGPNPGRGIEARFHRVFRGRKVGVLPPGRPGALVPPLENGLGPPQTGPTPGLWVKHP